MNEQLFLILLGVAAISFIFFRIGYSKGFLDGSNYIIDKLNRKNQQTTSKEKENDETN